ncbi:MAG: S8 family serine peptidase [Lachnospiraceae bacterium]|nr:S8 family serine peptidase [Lachnospiraceae bacterium]
MYDLTQANAAEIGRTVICVGSGNEGANGGHAAGRVTMQAARQEIAVANYEQNLRLQLWQNYSDEFRIYLISPGGRRVEMTAPVNGGKYTVLLENTKILAYQGEPSPYAVAKELYLEFLPEGTPYITSGIWTLELEPVRVVTGQYYLYLSDGAARSSGTFFFTPTPQVTMTIPATAAKVITVGAYDNRYDAYADFSGRGYADEDRTIGVITAGLAKPDIVAPGINILAPDLFGGYVQVTGTSFAAPIVSGAAALLMEWGIVRGNDPFLYGEKVKAKLRRGARPLRGIQGYPDDRVGWGKLCVADSLEQG